MKIQQNIVTKKDIINFFDDSYLTLYTELLQAELSTHLNFLDKNYLRNLSQDSKILDLCCGNGRHACNLNKKYFVDGIDINSSNITLAQKNLPSQARGKMYTADASDFKTSYTYDLIYCLENSIGYLADNVTLDIFKNISNNLLSQQGKVIIHFSNKYYLLKNLTRRIWFENPNNGYLLEERNLDIAQDRIDFRQIRIINHQEKYFSISLRLYTLQELTHLFTKANLKITNVYGDFKNNIYTAKSPEMIIEAIHY